MTTTNIQPGELISSELMYGNYLMKNGKVWQVNDIFGASGLVTMLPDESGESLGRLSIRDFVPIPLTEQWLLELGFENLNQQHSAAYIHIRSYLTLHIARTGLCFIRERITSIPNSMELPFIIRYVHQLQNLYFALTATPLSREKGKGEQL